jgi:DNA-binding CsgD family transcriptional regulator
MRLHHERADYGYRIERTTDALVVRGWGRATRADAHRWARDMRRAVRAAGPTPFDVLVDVRGHVPYDHDPVIGGVVRDTMAWCQEHGARRSAVVSDDPALLLLTRGLARGAEGVYPTQRYFNALHNAHWEADARRWLATGEEAHWLRPEEARAELLLLVDALAEAVALCTADGRLLRANPALAGLLGLAPGAGAEGWTAALARHPLGPAIDAVVAALAAPRAPGGAEPAPAAERRATLPDGAAWRVHGRVVAALFGPDPLLLVTAAADAPAAPPAADLGRDFGLTAREQQVARLVAGGASNAGAAAALGVRRATVRNHLTSVLRKTGAPNRTRLADLLRRAGRA